MHHSSPTTVHDHDSLSPLPRPLLIPLPNISPVPKRPLIWNSGSSNVEPSLTTYTSTTPLPLSFTSHTHNQSHTSTSSSSPLHSSTSSLSSNESTFSHTVQAVININNQLTANALAALKVKRESDERRRQEELKKIEEAKRLAQEQAVAIKAAQLLRKQKEQEEQERLKKKEIELHKTQEHILKQEFNKRQTIIKEQSNEVITNKINMTLNSTNIVETNVKTIETTTSKQESKSPSVIKLSHEMTNQDKPYTNVKESDITSTDMPPCMKIIQRMKKEINPIMKQTENKRIAIHIRKTINTAIGQLNNKRDKLNQVFIKVDQQLKQIKQQSEIHYAYALNLLAKSFCRQAEAEMRPDVTKAFPYGQVAVLLMTQHVEFRDYLFARMYKYCPYLVPWWPQPKSDYDIKHLLRKRIGEDNEKYMERMSTHIALFAAMVQTTPIIPNLKNPLDMTLAWIWLARVMNEKATPLMVYLIEKFLIVAGHAYLQQYGKQGQKIMNLLINEYAKQCGDVVLPVLARWDKYWHNEYNKWIIPIPAERNCSHK